MTGPVATPNPRVLVMVVLAAALCAGCTAWAEVQGVQVAGGFEYDFERGISPRIEVGYQYMRWNGAVAYGGSAGLAASPANGRVEVFADGRGGMVLFTAASVTPIVLGGALAITPWGLSPVLRTGMSGLMFMPPAACTVGLEGDQPPLEQQCGGKWTTEDEVHPNWLPRIDLLFEWTPVIGEPGHGYPIDDAPFSLSALFGATLANYWVVGGEP